ncbi:MAG: nitrogen regulation protein NR(II) [Polyangiales bacterium]
MSANTALVYTWAFLHLAAVPLLLFIHRHTQRREELVFAWLHAAAGMYALFGGLIASAPTAAAGEPFFRMQVMVGMVLICILLKFGHLAMRLPWRIPESSYVLGLMFALVIIATGVLTDPGDATSTAVHWYGGPIRSLPPTPALLVLSLVGFGVTVYLALTFFQHAQSVEAWTLSSAVALVLGGWVADLALRTFEYGAFVSDHTTSLAVMVLGYVVLNRFVEQTRALRARTKELDRQNSEYELLQEQLVHREQLATVGELSAVIAQEVRAPLTAIRHAVEGLRSPELPAEERDVLLLSLDGENDRLNRLVRDLLVYAKPVEPQFEAMVLFDVLEEALNKQDLDPRVQVRMQLEAAPDLVEGDPRLLSLAFSQIASNAIEAMPGGGELTVRGELARLGDDPALAIRFSDTGEGMDTLVRSRARDPFFTTRSSSTGLGLAIVERLVGLHGGQLEFANDDVHGTTVSVLLPARPRARLTSDD